MSEPVEPTPILPEPAEPPDEVLPVRHPVGEQGPELFVPPAGKTRINLQRRNRRIE